MGWALVLHDGAGDVPRTLPPETREPRLVALCRCLDLGAAALRDGRAALDVVELVVRPSFPLLFPGPGRAACSSCSSRSDPRPDRPSA